MHGCRAVEVFPTEQFQTMRAKCISQELSWQAPAKKWCVSEGFFKRSCTCLTKDIRHNALLLFSCSYKQFHISNNNPEDIRRVDHAPGNNSQVNVCCCSCCREAVLEGLTHPSEENTQRKEAVTTPVQKVDNPELVELA